MKSIEVDDQLYAYIASQTKFIGESASDILRRLLLSESPVAANQPAPTKAEPQPKKRATAAAAPAKKAVKAAPVIPSASGFADRVNAKTLGAFDKKVERFLFVLSQLYQLHTDEFTAIEDIRGKDRLYFAQSESALAASGKSTNPKAIPESPYWVVTNNNSEKKARLLSQSMELLGYDVATIDDVVELINQ